MTAVFSLPPLVDLTRPDTLAAATLRTPIAYDVLAPISNILDTLTLLSPAQYWETFAFCAVLFFGFWIHRRARNRSGFGAFSTIRAALRFIGGTVAVIGIMLVASRPMASLALRDRDLLTVDFHSHTSASHDGRAGFDAERNREWHSSSGFDAAYVTDHTTFDGAISGARHNPARAGDGTVLLPGVELRDGDEHPILIGVDPKRMRITSSDWKEAAIEADGGPVPPMLLLSMPGNILRIPLSETSGPVRIEGVEISDGCPRGMAQAARDGDAIRALSGNLGIAMVSASDNHGWGRTAPAWSVMRIPGWRNLSPAALDIAIRRTIVTQGSRAITVIARRTVPAPANRVEATFGGAMVALVMMRTMSLTDRLSWTAWSWGFCFLSLRSARRNRSRMRMRARKSAERKLIPVVEVAA